MPWRNTVEEDEDFSSEDDGRENPDEVDADVDMDEPELVPCPHCGRHIVEDAEQCPKCGQYISVEDSPRARPVTWWVFAAVVVIAIVAIGLRWL